VPRAEQARRLAAELQAYFDTEWRTTVLDHDCRHPPGHLHAAFWRALKARPARIGERQMERIIAG
jgi:hypothetical protein